MRSKRSHNNKYCSRRHRREETNIYYGRSFLSLTCNCWITYFSKRVKRRLLPGENALFVPSWCVLAAHRPERSKRPVRQEALRLWSLWQKPRGIKCSFPRHACIIQCRLARCGLLLRCSPTIKLLPQTCVARKVLNEFAKYRDRH